MELTQTRLKDLLNYDPTSGDFTWKVARGKAERGSKAGSWNHNGYLVISVDGRTYKAHRLAWLYMTGQMPTSLIDHEDRNRANNAWENLRSVSFAENKANSELYKNNTTGFKGVYREKNRFVAQVSKAGTKTRLGRFKSAVEAAKAYDKEATKIYGGIATTNKSLGLL